MPHKRSKKSIRDSHTANLGYDNAPIGTIAITSTTSVSATTQASSSSSSTTTTTTASTSTTPETSLPQGSGVLAPKPKIKKLTPKDKLNSFGGRKDLGGLSKTAHRIFNAASTREEYHESKKRKREEDDKAALRKNPAKPLAPLPYESLTAFNRRVEVALRPSIDTAIRGAKAAKKLLAVKAKASKKIALVDPSIAADAQLSGKDNVKGKGKDKVTTVLPGDSIDPFAKKEKVRNGLTEFREATQVRGILNVAMAPPSLKKAKRGLEGGLSINSAIPIGRMPVSDGLKKIMEFEREKAVIMYRQMKEKRDKEQRETQA